MTIDKLTRDAILRVGEVFEVIGRRIVVKVDKNKNLSDIFLDGEILRNVAVDSYIEIRKGFLIIVGKVEGEKIEEPIGRESNSYDEVDKNRRYLTVSLIGYIGQDRKFVAGTKELPLIGNEAYIITKDKIDIIHNLVREGDLKINIAKTDDDFDIDFPVDTLFNGHIAIFGNTGSGKSNTLATLYQSLVACLQDANKKEYEENTRFIVFDFNGEYIDKNCITKDKKVYKLSTLNSGGDKFPFPENGLLELEMLSILSDATEKTQKPFLRRALTRYRDAHHATLDIENYFKGILRNQVKQILTMSEYSSARQLIDSMRQILPPDYDDDGEIIDIDKDIKWHYKNGYYYLIGHTVSEDKKYFSDDSNVMKTEIYKRIDKHVFGDDSLDNFVKFLYVKLIDDVLADRVYADHIVPVIHRLQSRKADILKLFNTTPNESIWGESNFIVVNLNHVNLVMKKTLPLLLCKKIYSDHKLKCDGQKSLNIIIDEAHNILSTESFRESETWKDYRLETFEEIIKEGRKFGVFVTISSQRPSDISPTITSQAHNYFIHRLINRHDLAMISNAVSYIDRMTEESIPTLPTGTCIFSGVASQRPIKVHIKELADNYKPKSMTLQFRELVRPSSDFDEVE
ncbi:ATP-binding protein [Phototrophicus methaneseepsis]|uniref:ATP-binding protein n=1 Tax=Phototrophicus methaneseepsis TaxID=2710758 RepID=A0A7S8IE04_9CHLR|nr:ATP-binding protein [Phototrophicus methaneseepsis]QPC82062.1 ATP-binding protein [Phototrophicus methaneseepsis]